VDKTLITHIDEGLDFLGWRIQRHQKRGTNRHYVYNYPAKKALRSIKAKCKTICRMNVSLPLAVLLHHLNSVLRGWTAYFRPGGVRPGIRIPAHDRVTSGIWVASAQAPELGVEETAPPLLRRPMVATGSRGRIVQPRFGSHHALPAPGIDDPFALATGKLRTTSARRGLWRAGCGANSHVRFGRAA
jgi:Group II intron, maturase-specific domain